MISSSYMTDHTESHVRDEKKGLLNDHDSFVSWNGCVVGCIDTALAGDIFTLLHTRFHFLTTLTI